MGFASWGRTDTRVLTGMLGIAFVIEAFWGLVLPLLHVAGALDVVSTRDVLVNPNVGTDLAEADGMKLSVSESATLKVADPSLGERVLLDLPAVFYAVLILLGIYWLFLVARTLGAGDPFAPRNPFRLFGIAALIVVGTFGDSLLTGITTHQLVAGTSLEEHVPFSVDFSFLPLVVAALVAAVAEAFRIGVRLREDTEGLV
ncbi:DUF2975 family protein [Kribbella sp. VKM Ac-2527]|uniref:DUF2975 family protein n=1 Tax=Kribbella caucasensis TaxID=2512215 RepID=A0A4R6JJI5_9ACTN|nr:DUF2975 domain-containing protein [Kribbella sp. VKM Ac-2527]TDO35827.1 DUF2975 family protein [Kribbella sp. VKM Ac-2527]